MDEDMLLQSSQLNEMTRSLGPSSSHYVSSDERGPDGNVLHGPSGRPCFKTDSSAELVTDDTEGVDWRLLRSRTGAVDKLPRVHDEFLFPFGGVEVVLVQVARTRCAVLVLQGGED